MSLYVRHIAMLLCLVDCNITMIDTLRRLGASFDLAECCDFIQRYHNINSTVLCRIYYLYDHLYVVNN
jgi:hypothetical protein